MPTASRGSVYRRAGTANWSIKFYVDGHAHRETAGTPDLAQAQSFLVRRIDEVQRGTFRAVADRITFAT